jgi:hypothetical protein
MKTRQGLELLHSSLFTSTTASSSSSSSHPLSHNPQSSVFHSTQYAPYASATSIENEKDNMNIKNRIKEFQNRNRIVKTTENHGNSLESELLEMCKHLERENADLENTVSALKDDIKGTDEVGSGDLIPHYRLAIVRYVRTYSA